MSKDKKPYIHEPRPVGDFEMKDGGEWMPARTAWLWFSGLSGGLAARRRAGREADTYYRDMYKLAKGETVSSERMEEFERNLVINEKSEFRTPAEKRVLLISYREDENGKVSFEIPWVENARNQEVARRIEATEKKASVMEVFSELPGNSWDRN